MVENDVIDDATKQAMVKMAKFSNIIVHDDALIDPEIVIGILRKNRKRSQGTTYAALPGT